MLVCLPFSRMKLLQRPVDGALNSVRKLTSRQAERIRKRTKNKSCRKSLPGLSMIFNSPASQRRSAQELVKE